MLQSRKTWGYVRSKYTRIPQTQGEHKVCIMVNSLYRTYSKTLEQNGDTMHIYDNIEPLFFYIFIFFIEKNKHKVLVLGSLQFTL